jgi:MoxR-like ATPase
MLPIELDPEFLSGVTLQEHGAEARAFDILNALIARRVLVHFRRHRLTDPIRLNRVAERVSLGRFEDAHNDVHVVSFVTQHLDGWTLSVHERFFNYLAMVIPGEPDARLADAAPEPRQMLAFAEFMLRHELEHVIYPGREEAEVICSDAEFAMERREADPTYYRTLREALSDELNGLKGAAYLTLFDRAEQGGDTAELAAAIEKSHVPRIAELPAATLRAAWPVMGRELRSRLLDECYRRSRSTVYPLLRRARWLRTVLELFAEQIGRDREEAALIFTSFKERWGVAALLHDTEIVDPAAGGLAPETLFELFSARVMEFTAVAKRRKPPVPEPELQRSPAAPPRPSLAERVEAARADLLVPRGVVDLIDRNRAGAVGVSGSKYTELIETLLQVPWGKIHRIDVSAEQFVAGLERGHYGLERPKEILADFFTNLIWRYRRFSDNEVGGWHRSGSAFLFVGPPGVGKTSLAISVARNLGIPFHKLSLGGMRDESDLRGHGFTYEGSKPGAILQGLIKMAVLNGMFIMDEADKTERFAIATLLEILDPEQNHLYHDKYISSTVDIDLSNCHFVLTANTLDAVPPPVVDRCEVVFLDRYSVDEKVAIAREFLIPRIRARHAIPESVLRFAPEEEGELLRKLVTTYTREAGVRQLERVIRTLFLRAHRKEAAEGGPVVTIDYATIKRTLEEPTPPRHVNPDDRVGETLALGVDVERGVGSIIPVQATAVHVGNEPTHGYLSMVHATGNLEKVMDESRKVAVTGILSCADALGIDTARLSDPIHLHLMGGSSRKDGPSAGGAIALALASLLAGRSIRRDLAMTGEIDTQGRITTIGGLDVKLEAAQEAGCRTVVIPRDNLLGEQGIERLPASLKEELQVLSFEEWRGEHESFDYERQLLQVVAVDHIVQAAQVAFIDETELHPMEEGIVAHARRVAATLTARPTASPPCVQVIYVKEPDELDPGLMRSPFCEGCDGCRMIVVPASEKEVRARLPAERAGGRISALETGPEEIGEAVVRAIAGLREASPDVTAAVVAPYYSHAKGGTAAALDGDGIRLFANNYARQGVKIKRCKPLLTRAVCYLARIDDVLRAACPFVAERDGVVVADLALIPEKYRLDLERAQGLLNRAIQRWLNEIERVLRERPRGEPPPSLSEPAHP